MKFTMKALSKIIVTQVLRGELMLSDVVENESGVNKIWRPPVSDQLEANAIVIHKNQLKYNIYASFFQHPHMQTSPVSYHILFHSLYILTYGCQF